MKPKLFATDAKGTCGESTISMRRASKNWIGNVFKPAGGNFHLVCGRECVSSLECICLSVGPVIALPTKFGKLTWRYYGWDESTGLTREEEGREDI